jgi:uncharacterized membrane-anchored protein YjiN (DUF445 family)
MSTEHKILQRKGMKVLPSYVDEINNQESGKLFVIDKEATDLIHDAQAQKHAKQELQKTATSNGAMDFVNTLVNAVANNGQKEQPKKEVENVVKECELCDGEKEVLRVVIENGEEKKVYKDCDECVPSEDWNKEQLIAYLTEKNIEFKASFGIGKLLDLAKEGGQNA